MANGDTQDIDGLEAEIEGLQRDYIGSIEQKHGKLNESVALGQGSSNWQPLIEVTHRLAGSSGTYGLMAMSNALRFLENTIKDGTLPAAPPAVRDRFLQEWSTFFQHIKEQYQAVKEVKSLAQSLKKLDPDMQKSWLETQIKLQNIIATASNLIRRAA